MVMKKKYCWAGHVLRRGNARRTSRMTQTREQMMKRTKPGRPKLRCEDSFVGFVGGGWREVAQDGELWKRFCDLAPEYVRKMLDGPAV